MEKRTSTERSEVGFSMINWGFGGVGAGSREDTGGGVPTLGAVTSRAADAVRPAARTALAPLVARTTAIDDPGPLLDLLPERGSVAWVRRGNGLVGWGEAARLVVGGPQRFAAAELWWQRLTSGAVVRDDVALPGCGPVVFGSFAFADEPGTSVLVVPEVVVGRRGNAWWLTTQAVGGAVPAQPHPVGRGAARPPGEVVFADGAVSGAAWEVTVGRAVERIGAGGLDKVVLALDLLAEAEHPVDVRGPLRRLAAEYDACWTFHVDRLLGATPEMLVRLDKGLVTSRDDEHDLALAASLARSSKDLEEHEYAVRSVADALAPHCSSMNVPETPFVLHLPNVMHLATDVTGVLAAGASRTSSLSLAAALHPSAAVCGTPTPVARALIRELEGFDRGRYAGPVGWTDAAGDGEWGIALRCAEVVEDDPRRLRLFAGCGIVAGSDPADELAEAAAKLVPVRDALLG
jgi:menaquinone-specific isochorismate synthase